MLRNAPKYLGFHPVWCYVPNTLGQERLLLIYIPPDLRVFLRLQSTDLYA